MGETFMKNSSANKILIGIILVLLMGYSDAGLAEVNVNIGIGVPLPSLVISAPSSVVLILSSFVFFFPEVSVDVLF